MHTLNITALDKQQQQILLWFGREALIAPIDRVGLCSNLSETDAPWKEMKWEREKRKKQACYNEMALSGTLVPSEKSRSCMKQMLLVLWGTKVVTHPSLSPKQGNRGDAVQFRVNSAGHHIPLFLTGRAHVRKTVSQWVLHKQAETSAVKSSVHNPSHAGGT